MEIVRSIEVNAARIHDTVERLRYLRSALKPLPCRRISLRVILGLLIAGLSFVASSSYGEQTSRPPRFAPTVIFPSKSTAPARSWIVEQNGAYTAYSNGLQIREDYVTSSAARSFQTFSRRTLAASGPFTAPVGIVYHTTESLLLPMEAARNQSLVQTREDLLRHVRDGRLYNFLIDRFGQVFRIVPEDQVAHHAGHSVWADRDSIYEGLNDSFLGISFEARTGTAFEATPAQIRSGRILTEVLRGKYAIPDSNCVTHAQVSVNPDNMRIGYHTDWAANFPFLQMGLSTGYNASIPAIAIFGFQFDDYFVSAIGGHPWEGLFIAEGSLQTEAGREGLSLSSYREHLQQQYRFLRSHPHEHSTTSNRT